MRRRGKIFKDFKPVEISDDVVKALGRINENLKLILEPVSYTHLTLPTTERV